MSTTIVLIVSLLGSTCQDIVLKNHASTSSAFYVTLQLGEVIHKSVEKDHAVRSVFLEKFEFEVRQ